MIGGSEGQRGWLTIPREGDGRDPVKIPENIEFIRQKIYENPNSFFIYRFIVER